MKLIFIYGPPATGKLTVAKELAKLTNYKIFHNHLAVDLIGSVFEFGTDIFFDLNSKFRLEIFESAAKENINGLIFTYCYAHLEDMKFVKAVKNKIKKYKGDVCFIHLFCSKCELKKRVKTESRKNYSKIKSAKGLNETLKQCDFFTAIPFVKNYTIDNSDVSPKIVAQNIKKHFKL